MANLLHIKGSRTQVLSSFPLNSFGSDGDIVVVLVKGKGTYLCSKAGGIWYTANKLQQLNNREKTSSRFISTENLIVNNMSQSAETSDKFVINNNGKLEYRTTSEVINDLNIFESINYKTAHCSLGQYTDKESCEVGGGTWYYSENDSHDNVSSTAENQLLTVGQSIGNLDAEPTLLYDGSTLEIKYNSDYDDNWQTSAQTDLLKLSYDSSKNAIFNVNSSGHLTVDCTSDIALSADGGNVIMDDGTTTVFDFDVDNGVLNLNHSSGQTDITTTGDLAFKVNSTGDNWTFENSALISFDNGADDITVAQIGVTVNATSPNPILTLYDRANYASMTGSGPSIKFKKHYYIFGGGNEEDAGNISFLTEGNWTLTASTRDSKLQMQNVLNGDLQTCMEIGSDLTTTLYNKIQLLDTTDNADMFTISVGAAGETTIATVDDGATIGHLVLRPDGSLVLDPASQKTIINATDYLYFDGGTDTFIYESGADNLRFVVGNDTLLELTESGADGNQVSFGSSCAGFTQIEPTYDSGNTLVDFRNSNKQNLTFGAGNITHLVMYFPLVSGNFQLLIKQDGTGSRTITGSYKVREFDESYADGSSIVVWAGGSAPTLTTDANHVDILSFYWDADNEIAYGVATLDFQF